MSTLSTSRSWLVVGFGLIGRMPSWGLPIWNIAVVLNVFGAGVGRLFSALRQRLPNGSVRP